MRPAALPETPAASLANPPFVAGRVVAVAFRVFWRNAASFGLVAVAFMFPSIWLDLALGDRADASTLTSFLWNVLGAFVIAGVTRGTLDALDGRPVRLPALFGGAARSGFRVLGVSILGSLVTVLGLVLLVVPGLVAAAGLYVARPATVAEPATPPRAAIERSWALTRGHRASLLGILVLFLAIPAAVWFIAAGISSLDHGGGLAVAIVGNVAVAVATALPPVAAAVAYHDLRVEKEGVAASEIGAVFE